MKLQPLLDHWSAPADAGSPVAVFATTFVLDPDFFERDCLARFLTLQAVDEETGSADDTIARIELEEKLTEPSITVLADRSTSAERGSLRWNLLHCYHRGGLLHAKVAILIWENATRVVLGSANLTSAGYRRQIELALAADLGPGCLFPQSVLEQLANELAELLGLVQGLRPGIPAYDQAQRTLSIFRDRIASSGAGSSKVLVSLAPTKPGASPLQGASLVWRGSQPVRALHLSPFWDSTDATAVKAVRALLTGRGQPRSQCIATVISPYGTIPVTPIHRAQVNKVVELGPIDQESSRLLHAKCLLLESDTWIAALVGSSNHTKAGLGLGGRSHRELNVWLGASSGSAEGKALRNLIPQGKAVPADVDSNDEATDEDEVEPPVLPLGFQLCRLHCSDERWHLTLSLDPQKLPEKWTVRTELGVVLDATRWETLGRPSEFVEDVSVEHLPTFLTVTWEGGTASWTVLADDRHVLPPGPGIGAFKAHQLFAALSSGKSITEAMRDEATRQQKLGGALELDPLKRYDSQTTLLRRGRALSAALEALRRRLERPVSSVDALAARLASPLAPNFLAAKTAQSVLEGEQDLPEGLFTLGELALELGRVNWATTFKALEDTAEAYALVGGAIDQVKAHVASLGSDETALMGYATRCVQEARRCLPN